MIAVEIHNTVKKIHYLVAMHVWEYKIELTQWHVHLNAHCWIWTEDSCQRCGIETTEK